jgi:hypothetical protein
MEVRQPVQPSQRRGAESLTSLAVVAATVAAAVVARAARPAAAAAEPVNATDAAVRLALVAVALGVLVEVAAAFARRIAARGRWKRAPAAALARLGASLAAALVLSSAGAGSFAAQAACLAALLFVALALPAAPLPGARLLEAALAARMPQLVAARLAGRVGFTAALVGPAALLGLQKVRADLPSRAVVAAGALLLLAGVRRARAAAFVRELRLQARRPATELAAELRAELLAVPLEPEVELLEPLSPAQFRAFRDDCERCYSRR